MSKLPPVKPANFLRPRNVWAQLGDSRTMFGAQSAAGATFVTKDATEANTPVGRRNQGYQYWAEFLSNGGMQFPVALNFGYAGGTIVGTSGAGLGNMNYLVAPCIAAALADNARGVVFWIGTNDINGNNSPPGLLIAAKDAIISQITTAGLHCILLTDTPRGSTGFTGLRATAANLGTMLTVRAWDLAQTNRTGVSVVDLYDKFVSPTATTGDWEADDMTFDGVHQSPKSAMYIGRALLGLGLTGSPRPRVFAGNSDRYNATTNPSGCVSQNPAMMGSGGTPGTNGTGTIGPYWAGNSTHSRAGWTAVYSQPITNDGSGDEQWAQVTISGTNGAAASTDGFVQYLNNTIVPIGSRVQVVGRGQWDGLVGISGVQVGLYIGRASSPSYLYDGAESNMLIHLDGSSAVAGTFCTEAYTIPADANGTVNLLITLILPANAAVAGNFRFRDVGVRFV